MLMLRVVIGQHKDNIPVVIETYDLLSQQLTHATSTLFNAGTPRPQLSSCCIDSQNC
jgi:ribonucleotide reductase alpha subunit